MASKVFKMSEFTKLTKTSRKALRIYESRGLLKNVIRNEKQYRFYTIEHKNIIDEITRLKVMGFSLKEIQHILNLGGSMGEGWSDMLKQQLHKVQNEIAGLKKKEKVIQKLLLSKNCHKLSTFERAVFMSTLSEKIKKMTKDELVKCVKNIPNKDFLMTFALIDDEAKNTLLSVLSEKARALVARDFDELNSKYFKYWE